MDDRPLPQNEDAERAVIGACLIGDQDAADTAIGLVTESSFYSNRHRAIWSAIVDLRNEGTTVDVVTCANKLIQNGTIEKVGGAIALAQLSSAAGTSVGVEDYCRIIRESEIRRTAILRAQQLAAAAQDETVDLNDVIGAAAALPDVILQNTGSEWHRASDAIWEAVEALDEKFRNPDKLGGVTTGLGDLDEMLDGLQKGDMITIGARPSVGKTALGLNFARYACGVTPVAFVSVEMSIKPIMMRLLAMEAQVDAHTMRRGRLAPDQIERVSKSAHRIRDMEIFFSRTLREPKAIERAARKLKREHGIGLLIIDYLQLLDPVSGSKSERRSREQEVSAISRAIKATATNLDIPVVALAQLSRESERRDKKQRRPRLSDLRDSGSIEQDSDVVILLNRPEMCGIAEQDGASTENLLEADVAKQRNGPTGMVSIFFNKQSGIISGWQGGF
jgi:replicative DNA helicase